MASLPTSSAPPLDTEKLPQFAGHPAGLFVLFFAEMWERFSYYGMRALLVFYMTKGFLGFNDDRAYDVYTAYTALVYATPFIGGMLADRLLGARRAVVFGGILMASGHLLMTIENSTTFYGALALLIVGNGFFKPNISTIVGSLYPEESPKRDAGFTLFYMGINLGAALAPLVCGYVGETYGWHYGFGLATVGMLIGLAVFVAPTLLTQLLIGGGALATAVSMVWFQRGDMLQLAVNAPVAVALLVAGVVAVLALKEGPLPAEAGAPRDAARLSEPLFAGLSRQVVVLLAVVVAVPLIAVLVSQKPLASGLLWVFGGGALVYLNIEAFKSEKKERERLFAVFTLMFFSMLFWAFFEQAGSSINNFTDRNVDRVREERVLTAADVGQTVTVELTQEQLGQERDGKVFTLDQLDAARKARTEGDAAATTVSWTVTEKNVGMGVGGKEVPASVFQAANPIFILTFGLIFTAMWAELGRRRIEPNTAIKFALGLGQLAAGFGVLWYGTTVADGRGMVGMNWLVFGYLLHTTGELCLSPVGLSMVTRLSPARLASTVMGAWFLATAFSQDLAGVIAKLTAVGGEGGEEKVIPPPIETVHVYGSVFGQIAIGAAVATVVLFLMSPLLVRWMHEHEGAEKAA